MLAAAAAATATSMFGIAEGFNSFSHSFGSPISFSFWPSASPSLHVSSSFFSSSSSYSSSSSTPSSATASSILCGLGVGSYSSQRNRVRCAAFRFGVGAPIEDRDNVAGDADEILASRLKRVLESDASEEESTRNDAPSTKDGESVIAERKNYKGVSKRRERMQRLRDRIRRSSREGSLRDAREGMLKTAR